MKVTLVEKELINRLVDKINQLELKFEGIIKNANYPFCERWLNNNENTRVPIEDFIEKIAQRVVVLNSQNQAVTISENNEFMNIQEVAAMLKITVPTVYGLVHRKKIPYMKFGKKLMFEKAEIHSWLKNYKRKTLKEIQEDGNFYFKSSKK